MYWLTLVSLICGGLFDLHLSLSVGFLEQDIFKYCTNSTAAPENINFTFVQVNSIESENQFSQNITTLSQYDVLIGRYNYHISTICRIIGLPYYVLDEDFNQWTDPVLDAAVGPIEYGEFIIRYATEIKAQTIRFISDSSEYAMNVLKLLTSNSLRQCNLQPTDNSSTIRSCFRTVFQKSQPQTMYVIVTDDKNIDMSGTFTNELMLQSLHYQTNILYLSSSVNELMINYRLSRANIQSVRRNNQDNLLYNNLLQIKANDVLKYVIQQLSGYNKTNNTHIIINGNLQIYSKSLILSALKKPNSLLNPNIKLFYIYSVSPTIRLPELTLGLSYDQKTWTLVLFSNPNIKRVRAIYFDDKAFITANSVNNEVIRSGYTVDMLNNIFLPFGINYILFNDTRYPIVGRQDSNKSYSGILKALIDGVADITAFPVPTVSLYRSDFIHSEKVFEIRYSMLIKKATKSVDFLKFVKPYSILVWLMIIITILVLSIILWITNLISPNDSYDSEKMTLSNSIFMVFGSFLIAKMLVKPNMFSTQLFYILIWLGTLFLIVSYVANVTVMIAFENNQFHTFTTFDSLELNKGAYKFAFVNDSHLMNSILNETVANTQPQSVFRKLYEYAKVNFPNNYTINSTVDVERFLNENPNVGILNDEYHNMYYSLRNCQLITLIDDTYTVSYAYMMRTDFKYTQEVAQQIINLRESGITRTLENNYFNLGKCSTEVKTVSSISPLGLEDMSGIFILIAGGLVFCFPIALIEYIVMKIKLDYQRKLTGNSLVFGEVYTSKVTGVDKKGVYVEINAQKCCGEGEIYYIHKNNLIGKKNSKNQDAPAPSEQGIMVGTKLKIRYLGNSPTDSKRKFEQVNK